MPEDWILKMQYYIFRFPERNFALKSTGSCEPENKNLGLKLLLGGLIGNSYGVKDAPAKEGAGRIEQAAMKHIKQSKT